MLRNAQRFLEIHEMRIKVLDKGQLVNDSPRRNCFRTANSLLPQQHPDKRTIQLIEPW